MVTGETVVQPHRNAGDDAYDPWSNRAIIETLIGRAVGHIKPGQFDQGPTALALELSLLPSGRRCGTNCTGPIRTRTRR